MTPLVENIMTEVNESQDRQVYLADIKNKREKNIWQLHQQMLSSIHQLLTPMAAGSGNLILINI